MTDNVTDGASAPAAHEPALKSTDTSELKALQAKETPAEPAPEPQKPEAPETPQEPEGDEGADNAPAADSPDKGRRKDRLPRWVKERLERERLVTEQRTREQVLREVGSKPPEQPAEPVVKDKTLADFDFNQDAYIAYKAEQAIDRREQERAKAEAERQQAEAAQKFKARIDAFEERVGEGAWEEIESSALNTDPRFKPLCDLFMGDDHDLDIALELAGDIPEAERLLALPPLSRVRELVKLAEKFSGEPTPPEKAPVLPKKLTNAPPPPKTVAGAGKATVDIDDPNLSTAQRIAEWKRQGKA